MTDEDLGLVRMLWPHLRPQLRGLSGALSLGIIIAAISAVQPLVTRLIIDRGLIGHQMSTLFGACAVMLLLSALALAVGAVHRVVYMRASGRVLFALRGAAYERLLCVPPRRLSQLPVGDLVSRLDGDIAEMQRFGTDGAASFISGVLSLAAVAAVMISLSWRLSILFAGLLPLQFIIRHFSRRPMEASMSAVRVQAARISAFLVETLSGARHVQSAAAEQLESGRLRGLADEYLRRAIHQQLVSFGTGSCASYLGHVVTAAAFALGGWFVSQDRMSVGTLLAFISYIGRMAGSASSIGAIYTGYQRMLVSLKRVQAIYQLAPVVEATRPLSISSEARGCLLFERVSVCSREDAAPVLDAVDIHIPAGSKVALRGASGSGKSTIADLLQRFLEPDTGCILLDGTPLQMYRLADLRKKIVVVEHSPILFRGTILENLLYGHPDIDATTAIGAARDAGIDEFVSKLPDRYDTRIGEGGVGLSTGQRQRIAIARALLANPLVVVMDEAMSGLDLPAAVTLHVLIDSVFKGRTRIVISHQEEHLLAPDLSGKLEAGRLQLTTVLA